MLVSLTSRLNGSFRIPCLLLLLLLSAPVAFGQAQSNAADLQGTVRDATGAVVANAGVTARNPGTNFSRSVTTNDEGFYRIINLPPGDYEVTVEATNFKKAVLPKVTVTVGQAASLDVQLEPGQISESVTISDATSEVVEQDKTAVFEVSTTSDVASEIVTLSVSCPSSSVTLSSALWPTVTVTFGITDFLKLAASTVTS